MRTRDSQDPNIHKQITNLKNKQKNGSVSEYASAALKLAEKYSELYNWARALNTVNIAIMAAEDGIKKSPNEKQLEMTLLDALALKAFVLYVISRHHKKNPHTGDKDPKFVINCPCPDAHGSENIKKIDLENYIEQSGFGGPVCDYVAAGKRALKSANALCSKLGQESIGQGTSKCLSYLKNPPKDDMSAPWCEYNSAINDRNKDKGEFP